MKIVVETFLNQGEPSTATRRVRPVEGQGYSTELRVECSKAMRNAFPLGKKFLLDVQWKHFGTGSECLYSNFRDAWSPLTEELAMQLLSKANR
jgi:hypothetical protein